MSAPSPAPFFLGAIAVLWIWHLATTYRLRRRIELLQGFNDELVDTENEELRRYRDATSRTASFDFSVIDLGDCAALTARPSAYAWPVFTLCRFPYNPTDAASRVDAHRKAEEALAALSRGCTAPTGSPSNH